MGIFKNLFGSSAASEQKEELNWKVLNSEDQLVDIVEESSEKSQVIFKHSTRCGISNGVLRQFEKKKIDDSVDLYYLDLLAFRNVSNAIASKFDVIHQSPQLLIIKNGKVIKHASHYDLLSIEIL